MGDWGGCGEEEIFGPATYLTQRPLRTQRNTGGGMALLRSVSEGSLSYEGRPGRAILD